MATKSESRKHPKNVKKAEALSEMRALALAAAHEITGSDDTFLAVMILRDEHDYPRLGDLLMKAAGLTEADIRAIKDQLAAEAAEKRKDEAAAADVRTALCRWLGNDDAVQGIRLKDGSLLTLPAVVQE